MGRLIPAGTGMEYYRNVQLKSEEPPPPEEGQEVDFGEADVFEGALGQDGIPS
jgi:hypothetical protein